MSDTDKRVFLVSLETYKMAFLNDRLMMVTDISNPGSSGWSAAEVAKGLGDEFKVEVDAVDLINKADFPRKWVWDDVQHYMTDLAYGKQQDDQETLSP